MDEGPLRLEQAQGLAFGTMVQAVVTHLAEAARKYVLYEPADELQRREARGTTLTGFAVAVAEHNPLVIVSQDGGIGQRDAVDVACEIGERVVAGTDGLGVHDSRRLPDRFGDGG